MLSPDGQYVAALDNLQAIDHPAKRAGFLLGALVLTNCDTLTPDLEQGDCERKHDWSKN
jgi:hypothetical protein